ncbi:MAG: hypothetical protein ACRD3W_03015, partial [Terriglobales bacterium]
PDPAHAGPGLFFYRAGVAVIGGGATQLAEITTLSHTNFPSGRSLQGWVKLWTLTRTHRAGMIIPPCRAETHPVRDARTASSRILLITTRLRSVFTEAQLRIP